MKQWRKKISLLAFAGLIMGMVILGSNPARAAGQPGLDRAVAATLTHCQQISVSCATTTKNSYGVLVFPDVVKADLIIGGAGGTGALIETGQITGYYNIGSASAGLQAGIENS